MTAQETTEIEFSEEMPADHETFFDVFHDMMVEMGFEDLAYAVGEHIAIHVRSTWKPGVSDFSPAGIKAAFGEGFESGYNFAVEEDIREAAEEASIEEPTPVAAFIPVDGAAILVVDPVLVGMEQVEQWLTPDENGLSQAALIETGTDGVYRVTVDEIAGLTVDGASPLAGAVSLYHLVNENVLGPEGQWLKTEEEAATA